MGKNEDFFLILDILNALNYSLNEVWVFFFIQREYESNEEITLL